ncbi:ABC transporter ATP-binding protein/permease [Microvirga sp. CF3062]|uniref:ABC transporter ATP-binding protein/permease n=1 Tax=Microvirga sp. CF3062 TaxID=3110182 RepID=UPI002E775D6D|nr:ABC transporter ATP-binding protein/permease [Microvirga sp. CF3062]MEE1656846.1 ABC transporter ATP-binding protein/permease [Microvirga sp. CF3062]
MPDFDPKLGRQVPPPPATGREQEVGPGQDNTLAKEANAAAAHQPDPNHPDDAIAEVRPSIGQELYALFRDMLRGRKGWPMLRLCAFILVVLIGNMFGQVRLNQWNGAFFDAVEKRNTFAFFDQLLVFLAIIAVLLALVVAQTWLQERLKIRLRERLTHVLLNLWLKPNHAYQLGFMGKNGSQPDQRMQEDCRLFSELSTELGVGMLQALLLLISFIGVLWGLSSPVTFTIAGTAITIPGYMVWVAVGYAGIGSGLTWLVGRPLIRLNTERYAREADLRFALVRVNESAESVALYNGEPDERRSLDEFVEAVLKASRRLSSGLARLTWITSGYGWLAIVVPILAAAPDYFAGRLSFGEMMMVVGAFNQVQSALRYFVDNFPKIADWRSAVLRVATFRQASLDLEEVAAENRRIDIAPHPKGWLSFESVSIALNDGSILIEDATAEIKPGERVLIMGESGAGKSTLFRAISGLWPWGSGKVSVPRPEQMMFLPQRPYLPLGTLRAAISYPASPDTFDDADVRAALERCGLGEFLDMLDRHERWDRSLSLGQQQRVAFARVILHKPQWVFMDEATSALDEDNQTSMLALFENELKGASVLSIGHRPGLEEFHTRTLHIRKTSEGAVLLARPMRPSQPKLGPRWIGRFRRKLRQSHAQRVDA